MKGAGSCYTSTRSAQACEALEARAAMAPTTHDKTGNVLEELEPQVRAELLRGMRVPRPVVLRAGAIVVRFANSTLGPDRWIRSPWWIDDSAYGHVEAARDQSLSVHGNDPRKGMTLGLLAKQALAVRQRWSEDAPANLMDLVIKAEVARDLPAFAGRGHTQYEVAPNGFRLTWTGWSSVEQLFIPELAVGRGSTVASWVQSENAPALWVRQCLMVPSQQLF
jgi:hypothetical protein